MPWPSEGKCSDCGLMWRKPQPWAPRIPLHSLITWRCLPLTEPNQKPRTGNPQMPVHNVQHSRAPRREKKWTGGGKWGMENIRGYSKWGKWCQESHGRENSVWCTRQYIVWSRVYGGWDESKDLEYLGESRRKYFFFLTLVCMGVCIILFCGGPVETILILQIHHKIHGPMWGVGISGWKISNLPLQEKVATPRLSGTCLYWNNIDLHVLSVP